MTTYYVVTVLAVWLAFHAGSRTLVGPEERVLPPRKGVATFAAASSALILIAFAALRYWRGTDYGQYAMNYDVSYRNFSWSGFRWDKEPALEILAWISVRTHDEYTTMFALASIITVGLFMRSYAKYSTAFGLSVLLFVLLGVWTGTFNGVRQFGAAAVVVAGHSYIINRQWFRFALVIGLASLFHITALAFVLLYFVPRRKLTLVGVGLLVIVALIATNGYDAAGEFWDAFRDTNVTSTSYFSSQVNPLRIAMAFVPYLVFRFFSDEERFSERQHFYVNMTLLHGAFLLAAYGSTFLARFAIYAVPFVALGLPVIIQTAKPRIRSFLVFALLAVYAAFWYIELVNQPDLNPYRWIFGVETLRSWS